MAKKNPDKKEDNTEKLLKEILGILRKSCDHTYKAEVADDCGCAYECVICGSRKYTTPY